MSAEQETHKAGRSKDQTVTAPTVRRIRQPQGHPHTQVAIPTGHQSPHGANTIRSQGQIHYSILNQHTPRNDIGPGSTTTVAVPNPAPKASRTKPSLSKTPKR